MIDDRNKKRLKIKENTVPTRDRFNYITIRQQFTDRTLRPTNQYIADKHQLPNPQQKVSNICN